MGDIWKSGAKVDYKASLESIPLYGYINGDTDIIIRVRCSLSSRTIYRLTLETRYQKPLTKIQPGDPVSTGDTRWFGSHRYLQKVLPTALLSGNYWFLMGDKNQPQYQYHNPGIYPLYTNTIRTPEVESGTKLQYILRLEYSSGGSWKVADEEILEYFVYKITIDADRRSVSSGDEVHFYGIAPPNKKITIKDVNNSLGGSPTRIGTTYSDARGNYSVKLKVHRSGMTGDYDLNIVAATGSLQSKPFSIDVSFISDVAKDVGEGLSGLGKGLTEGLNVDWDKVKLYGGIGLAGAGILGGLYLFTKAKGQQVRIKIER